MSYEEECRVKEQFIKDSFERIGKLYPEYDSFEGCKQLVGYRNKAQYPVAEQDGSLRQITVDIPGQILTGMIKHNNGKQSHSSINDG